MKNNICLITIGLYLLFTVQTMMARDKVNSKNGFNNSAHIDTLTWRTFQSGPPEAHDLWFDEPRGDSLSMWFKPPAPCTLKAIRIWQKTYGATLLVDVFRARYDGHIMDKDSTNAMGWIGYNEDGQWIPGWILGHSPLGEHIWGPFPLNLKTQDPDWIEISTEWIEEPFIDNGPFLICLCIYDVLEYNTFFGMEDERTVPYHFFKYFPDKRTAPGRAHKGWYLMSSSLWIDAIVSYSMNTPPEITDMSVQNDTYAEGPFAVTANIKDFDVEGSNQAGIASVYLVWDIFGYADSTIMSGSTEDGEFHAEIPPISVGDTVHYCISATDKAGAHASNPPRIFSRLTPKNPEADILLVNYGRDITGPFDYMLKEVLDSVGYDYEYWNVYEHKGIDESVYLFGWQTVIPYGGGAIPKRGYEGNIWVDFLESGTTGRPVNMLYIDNQYIFNANEFQSGDFAFDYFGMASANYSADSTSVLIGTYRDPVSGSFFNSPIQAKRNSPFWVPSTSSNENAFALFQTQKGKTTGVRYNGNHFKTVYLPWEFLQFRTGDSLNGPSEDIQRLMINIFEWFGTRKGTGVDNHSFETGPEGYALFQNYPNPFNGTTDIRYEIVDSGLPLHTRVRIYNILGQEVKTLVNNLQETGYYSVTWDGEDSRGWEVPSGVYFYRLSVNGGQRSETRKMVLLR